MKTIEKILDAFTAVIVAMAALLLLPWLFGIRPYVVMSGSMAPSITKWSIAYVDQNIVPERITEGDILAYKLGGETVTHRVVGITPEGFETKGDANEKADLGVIPRNSVLGREIFSIPYLGYLIYHLRSAVGLILAAVIIACYMVIAVLSDKEKIDDKKKGEVYEQKT